MYMADIKETFREELCRLTIIANSSYAQFMIDMDDVCRRAARVGYDAYYKVVGDDNFDIVYQIRQYAKDRNLSYFEDEEEGIYGFTWAASCPRGKRACKQDLTGNLING